MTTATAEIKCSLVLSSPGRGERVLVRSEIPLEAEYAMFEIGEIELRTSEPGRIREHGYQTTVQKARGRLANVGMSGAVAREVAEAMQPVLSDAYARGAAAKRVARYLGAVELFQSDGYDATTHLYRGVFLDLAALSRDLELDHASATLQALYLASILENEPEDTEVIINTDACTKGGKPGTRTYKRPTFADVQRLMNALGGLAHKNPQPQIAEALPRSQVIEFLRQRQASAPDDDSRAMYKSLETTLAARDMPERGPLALPELWAIEQRIEANQFEGTLDQIDEAERRHGRTPGTTYLRARIALELRLEPPKLIAERVSALALSMTSFEELALLAAEAWLEAGDPRRAMPYARDLVNAPNVDEGLLLRAQALLERAETGKPKRRMSPTVVEAHRPAPLPKRGSLSDAPPESVPTAPPPPLKSTVPPPEGAPLPSDTAEQEPFTQGLGIEDLVLESEESPAPARSSRPARSLPPPLPSSRSMRAAPAVASSSKVKTAAGLGQLVEAAPAPAKSKAPSVPTPPTLDEIAIPDIPTDPSIPNDRPSSFPALRSQRPAAADAQPVSIPPPLDLDLTPADPAASFTLDLPGPDAVPEPVPMTQPLASRRPRLGMVTETRPPASYDPRAEPDTPLIPMPRAPSIPEMRPIPAPKMRSQPAPPRRSISSPAEPAPFSNPPPQDDSFGAFAGEEEEPPTPPQLSAPPLPLVHGPNLESTAPSLPPTPSEPEPPEAPEPPGPVTPSALPPVSLALIEGVERELEPPIQRAYMRGASMPPFRHEDPPPLLPKAPLLPKVTGDELAEHLALPPGIGGEPKSLDVLPTSVLEARIQFTLLSRELGLDYRLKRGIELRTDATGIESMQAVLAEMFPDRIVHTPEDAYEVRRHGAFLSEILARRLDAEWVDISPEELGHWVMIVPPDTRIWPFGRVSRLISMGQKERDLVSYFFELTARSRAR